MSPFPLRRRYAAIALTVLALLLAGCGGSDDGSDDAAKDVVGWTAATHPVVTTGPVWARGGTIHLGDGTVIKTGTSVARFVVAGDGAYFVRGTAAEAAGDPVELLLATPRGVGDTGSMVDPDTLRASPDGRYVAFVEHEASAKGSSDDPGHAVVVDLTTDKKAVRLAVTAAGPAVAAGRPAGVDDPGVVGLTDKRAYVLSGRGITAYALPSGKAGATTVTRPWSVRRPWYAPRDRGGAAWNAAHTWTIERTSTTARFRSAKGRHVRPRAGASAWTLVRWVDGTTALGYAYRGHAVKHGRLDPSAASTLIACRVPGGKCRRIPGSTGGFGTVELPVASRL